MTDGSDDALDPLSSAGSDGRGSGNDAIAEAAERAQHTADKNIVNLPGLPVPDETANLRQGPDLHPGLLALLPMVGVWRGLGEGHDADTGDYHFGQQIVVGHDGGNYLTWESRSWRVDDDAQYQRPDLRETGFWRIGPGDAGDEPDVAGDESIEFLLAHAEGWIELFYGRPLTQTSWELATDVVITSSTGSATGRQVGGAKRLYGLVEGGDLAYVEERIDADGDLVPRLSAKLARHIG